MAALFFTGQDVVYTYPFHMRKLYVQNNIDRENNLKIAVFFADSYSAWQRGSNENANALLRGFYPKKQI